MRGGSVVESRDEKHARRARPDGYVAELPQDVKQSRLSDGGADTWELAIDEIRGEVGVASAGGDAAQGLVSIYEGLKDGAGIVVEPARDGRIDDELGFVHTESEHPLVDLAELRHSGAHLRVIHGREIVELLAVGEGAELEVLEDGGDFSLAREQGLELLLDLGDTDLVDLVDEADSIARESVRNL